MYHVSRFPPSLEEEEVRQPRRLTVEEQGDRRAGRIAVETLVRDRLAFPCFLLLLCCP